MTAFDYAPQERLLRALAEQLKLPLLHIARQSELHNETNPELLTSLSYTADMAMRLIDSYLLSTQQATSILELEPVSISSLLHDTAHRLSPLAKQYNQELEIHLSGKYGPVMAHRESLEAAYTMLGYSLIESQPQQEKLGATVFAAHRSTTGIVAGIFGGYEGLTTDMFRRARALYGHSRQALPTVSASAGAGIFLADSLFSTMSTTLRVAHHRKMSGLAATLLPSHQLQLV